MIQPQLFSRTDGDLVILLYGVTQMKTQKSVLACLVGLGFLADESAFARARDPFRNISVGSAYEATGLMGPEVLPRSASGLAAPTATTGASYIFPLYEDNNIGLSQNDPANCVNYAITNKWPNSMVSAYEVVLPIDQVVDDKGVTYNPTGWLQIDFSMSGNMRRSTATTTPTVNPAGALSDLMVLTCQMAFPVDPGKTPTWFSCNKNATYGPVQLRNFVGSTTVPPNQLQSTWTGSAFVDPAFATQQQVLLRILVGNTTGASPGQVCLPNLRVNGQFVPVP